MTKGAPRPDGSVPTSARERPVGSFPTSVSAARARGHPRRGPLARAMSEQGLSVVDASKALVKAWAKLAPDEKQRFNARAAELNASNGV